MTSKDWDCHLNRYLSLGGNISDEEQAEWDKGNIPMRLLIDICDVLDANGGMEENPGDDPAAHRRKVYRDYLQSETWRQKRDAVLFLHGGKCGLCNSEKSVQVHHKTYDRIFNELPSDLIPLCARCHKRHHFTPDRGTTFRDVLKTVEDSGDDEGVKTLTMIYSQYLRLST